MNWILSALVLMLGTIGLPHILVRFYTVPNAHAARLSVGWALVFIALLYLTAPLYATIARWVLLQRLFLLDIWGRPIDEARSIIVENVPAAENWFKAKLILLKDLNNNGLLDPGELIIQRDIIVIGMPDFFGMPWVVAALVATGGLAAALSTADGLIMAMSTAVTRGRPYRVLILAPYRVPCSVLTPLTVCWV